MNVYLVARPEDECDYDETHAVVVIASSKKEALQVVIDAKRAHKAWMEVPMAAGTMPDPYVGGDESIESWERASVTKVRLDRPSIVLVDFHAG